MTNLHLRSKIQHEGAHGAPGYSEIEPANPDESSTDSSLAQDVFTQGGAGAGVFATPLRPRVSLFASSLYGCHIGQLGAVSAATRYAPEQPLNNYCFNENPNDAETKFKAEALKSLGCPQGEYQWRPGRLSILLEADHRFSGRNHLNLPKGSVLHLSFRRFSDDKREFRHMVIAWEFELPESAESFEVAHNLRIPGASTVAWNGNSEFGILPSRSMQVDGVSCRGGVLVHVSLGETIVNFGSIECDVEQAVMAKKPFDSSPKVPYVSLPSVTGGVGVLELGPAREVRRGAVLSPMTLDWRGYPLTFQKFFVARGGYRGILLQPGETSLYGQKVLMREGTLIRSNRDGSPRGIGIVARDVPKTQIKAGDFIDYTPSDGEGSGDYLAWVLNSPRTYRGMKLKAGTLVFGRELFSSQRYESGDIDIFYPPEGHPPPPPLQGPVQAILEYDSVLIARIPPRYRSIMDLRPAPSAGVCLSPLQCP